MTRNTIAVNEALGEFRAYLETLTFIQVDPRLSCTVGAVAGLHARGLQKLRQTLTDGE